MDMTDTARRVYTVSQVNRHVKNLLADDFVLSGLWISGEVSNYKPHSTGHRYFTLKDDGGAISAVMFASDAATLTFEPENGQQVEAYGSVSLYEKTGAYQVYIRRMMPRGRGSLYEAFEALKAKLSAEGLFDNAHKQAIPRYPRKVGLVTSDTGAALRDMVSVSRRRFPGVKLVLCPCLVQGVSAAPSIVESIRTLDKTPKVDVIIVGRGGGSIEDLWAFNEESVARAIYEARTPIISAVGHETDFTIADFAADLRAPTPSAAAELAVFDSEEELMAVEALRDRMAHALRIGISAKKSLLIQTAVRIKRCSPQVKLSEWKLKRAHSREKIGNAMGSYLAGQKAGLSLQKARIELLNPLSPLSKGYAYISDEEGTPKSSVNELEVGAKVTLVMQDGSACATVDSVSKENLDHGSR